MKRNNSPLWIVAMILSMSCQDSSPVPPAPKPAPTLTTTTGCDTTVCGDHTCDGVESCATCPTDCGVCPVCPPPAPVCGDRFCNGTETCSTCAADCGACPPVCGDHTCNGAETCTSCAGDCGACPPVCGDKACNGTETCSTCSADCGVCPPVCGDHTCNGTETCTSCAMDCGTCPLPATGFTFSAAGDFGSNADAAAVLDQAPKNGEFFLMLGDLSYGSITPESAWCTFVKSHVGPSYPVEIVSGNHEYSASTANGVIDNFIATNCLPNKMANVQGAYGKEYYFDYPSAAPLARIIAVSPQATFDVGGAYTSTKGSAHYLWAANAIDSARAAGIKWIIVATHRPCITAGVKTCEMGTDFFNLLLEKKVDLVLQGHDHGYQRSKSLALSTSCPALAPNIYNAACVADAGLADTYVKGAGAIFVINGMGGEAGYALSATDPEVPYMAKMQTGASTWGVARVKISATSLDLDFIRASGGTFTDHFTIGTTSTPVPVCGDAVCNGTETCTTCAGDCGACPPTIEPAVVNIPVTVVSSDLVNPERGFYKGLNLVGSATSAVAHYASGHTVDIALIQLDAYRAGPIDAAFLTGLDNGFHILRTTGVKVILRFRYNSSGGPDAPLSVVLGHIAQLAPIIAANSDVIAVQQAGFIGNWGEWNGSTNNLTTVAAESAITTAILGALPANRSVQVRTPMQKDGIFPGGPLMSREDSYRGRTGHHNDCFLASATDYGTYGSPVAFWEGYVAQDSRWTPVGGETCAVFSPRSDCPASIAEMKSNHWSYLNEEYNTTVLNNWKTQGCYNAVHQYLGYYLSATRVLMGSEVRPGGVLPVEFDINNTGFAAPFNYHPVYLSFTLNGVSSTVFLPVNPRDWLPGTVTMKYNIRVPYNLTPGVYQVSVWMPDEAMSIRNDSKYAVKLANPGNVINSSLPISTTAPGAVDQTATVFSLIP